MSGFFDAKRPAVISRAPGRLDVMGGIADYSGSLVLEMPIAEGTRVTVQRSADEELRILTRPVGAVGESREFRVAMAQVAAWARAAPESAREFFRSDPDVSWAAYVVGVWIELAREKELRLDRGWRVLVNSSVPEGKGVSSSAALEVATMHGLAAACDIELDGREIATLCQRVENQIVGAPCGIMDQMTCALGRKGQLLELLCQPSQVRGFLPLPPSLRVWGIDSGIRHAVTGSDYTAVRTGAFMGYRILAELEGLRVQRADHDGTVVVEDPRWNGYLANVAPSEFEERFEDRLPVRMQGSEFLRRYGGTTDPVTSVDPEREYAIRAPTAHPIREHARVQRFAELLVGDIAEHTKEQLGAAMFASHASYSACGLGSAGTDRLVQRVRDAGPSQGLHGAKITGGGSGGTVAVLGDANAGEAVHEIARRYEEETGHRAQVFAGSSPGAVESAPLRTLPRRPCE